MEYDNEMMEILSRRAAVPKTSEDLSERIIHAAIRTPRVAPLAPWYRRLQDIFSFPIPRAAIAASVVIFLAVGVSTQLGTPVVSTQDAAKTDYEFTMVLDVFDEGQTL